MKLVNIILIPVFKKGSLITVRSHLSVFHKLLEKLMYNRIRWYDTLKYGDVYNKFIFLETQDLKRLNTC